MIGACLRVALIASSICMFIGLDYRAAGLIGLGCAALFAWFGPRADGGAAA